MSDPLEDRFRDFSTGAPAVNPASPAEIRDRGDRLRRRRTALTAAGAALAIALVATPIAVLVGADDEAAPGPADNPTVTDDNATPGPSVVTEIPQELLPAAGDLPTRDRLTAWEEVEDTDVRLVGCQPEVEPGADEVIQRSFVARIAPAEGLPAGEEDAAQVRVSVLQYGSEADAEAAEAAVTGWIRGCEDPAGSALDGARRQGGLVDTEAGSYATWVYPAPEVCTDDCDAAWFERMSVLADQGRMVVVSFREVGGPLEPEGLDATMRDLMLQAAGRSMPG